MPDITPLRHREKKTKGIEITMALVVRLEYGDSKGKVMISLIYPLKMPEN